MTDSHIRQRLESALRRDLNQEVTKVMIGRSDDGMHIAAGVSVAADRTSVLEEQLDDWSDAVAAQLSAGDVVVTVYAQARCCGGNDD